MKNTKDFYNKTAVSWADRCYSDETMLPCLKEFMSRLPANPRVLDLCCGTGHESMRLKQLAANVVGLDFSEESIKVAKERNTDIEFHTDDMLNSYSYLGRFDGIVIIAGLIHLPNEKLNTAFKSMAEVLNKNGLILVVVKDGIGKIDSKSYTEIDGEKYDRDFYAHTLDEIIANSKDYFEFIKEILPDDNSDWKNYLLKLKETKR
ncbi:MAG: hypothetical protein A2Y17_01865 [Clostridiales bacterium GWF2_38_85]|nr:MAG: hypothetical protein A2Y17_01865 [Clostridiales bacterium GWF2_38_85]HBL84743.1 hypothetical protein [Clostridiales bacterium]